MKALNTKLLSRTSLPKGTEVYYFFRTSKQNVPIDWETGTVISTQPHFVIIRTEKGRKTNISYEDIRKRPKSALTEELSEGYMVDYILDLNTNTNGDSDANIEAPVSAGMMSQNFNTPISERVSEMTPPEQLDNGSLSEKIHAINEIDVATL